MFADSLQKFMGMTTFDPKQKIWIHLSSTIAGLVHTYKYCRAMVIKELHIQAISREHLYTNNVQTNII